jgi:uncharacterized membrane protein
VNPFVRYRFGATHYRFGANVLAVFTREALEKLPSRARLSIAIAVGVITGVITGLFSRWQYGALIGWDCAALLFTASVWIIIMRMTATSTRTHATREDPGRTVTDLTVLVAAVASLAGVGAVLLQSDSDSATMHNLVAGLGLLSVALSWFAVHTLFTLRYARLYYTGQPGGIDFNQDEPPSYLDFAYMAFTVGMTFQISDTNIRTSLIRATTLRHALLSYLFGAVILAAAINVVVGIAKPG